MKWIKTTDQLPPVGCYVLGYVTDCTTDVRYFAVLKWTDEAVFFSNNELTYYFKEVTHWTHLPNAPTQEEDE